MGEMKEIFKKGSWINVAITMLLRNIYNFLWYFTIIGGIIKMYEYRMIPYILAENPKTNRKNAGFTDEERAGFTNLLAKGFTDTYRHLNGDVTGAYTWWAQRSKTSKINNTGWRIDYW